LESYIYARDNYLKPGGALLPSKGNIYLAPFTDATLWSETMGKARFWYVLSCRKKRKLED
jgi:histone-arginine methyltransferase CARM1